MAVIHGRKVKILNISGTALIGGAKSCTIHKKAEAIETASPSSGTARTYITGRTSWECSISHLLLVGAGGLSLVGNTYTIQYQVNGSKVYSGTAICTEANITATVGNLAQGSIKFQGTGQLS